MAQLFANNAASTLASPAAATDTALTLTDGTAFPTPTSPDSFLLTLASGSPENAWEIVKVTARSGNVVTVARAQEGTTAQAWAAGAKAELRLTAGTLAALAGGGGSTDAYSTSETATNKIWTNGKIIYRKVVTYTWTSGSTWTLSHGITGITGIVSLNAIFYRNSQSRWLSIPTASSGNSFTIQADASTVYFYSDTSAYAPGIVTVILEYTK